MTAMQKKHLLLWIIGMAACLGGALLAYDRTQSAPSHPAAGTGTRAPGLDRTGLHPPPDMSAPTASIESAIPKKGSPRSSSVAPVSSHARVAPVIDWDRYPGSLDTQANQALDTRDGPMAMDLANRLFECDLAFRQQNSASRGATERASPEVQAESLRQAQERQRLISNCQTVVNGHQAMRSRLLELAMEQRTVGAAVEIYAESLQRGEISRRAEVLQAMALDASAGDLKSLSFVAADQAQKFGITLEAQQALRHGFELAANDKNVGHLVANYFETSQSLSGALTGSRFNNANLTHEVKSQGQVLAAKIIARLQSKG